MVTFRRTMVLMSMLAMAGAASGGADELKYVRKDTRDATRRATLANYMPGMQLGPWWIVGPFDNTGMTKHNVAFPPEGGVDLKATYTDKSGLDAAWTKLDDDAWMMIDLKRFGAGEDERNTNAIGYLYREIIADADGEALFEMGSDDGVKLWVNDHLVVDADVYRGMNIQDHQFSIQLRKGRNTLLAKITQGVGGWQFQMRPRIDNRVAALLAYHLNRDFPVGREGAHYQMLTVLEPKDVVLEVGGLDVMDDGRPIVTTRRGEAWVVDDAYADPPLDCTFTRFAFGLHEPLGALWHDGGLHVSQRGEVTRLIDSDGDDRADVYESFSEPWGVSGNYHEFAFGPEFDGAGRFWVTLNLGFCASLGKSIVPWRGWAMIVEPDGRLTPVCGGLRSPNGLGRNAAGDMFYTDNQGDWVGTCKLSHLDFGDWHGHPGGDRWYTKAGMTPPAGEADFKPPAVWFPYARMGQSASDIVLDDTGGAFGPFEGQLFVGDQYAATVMRVYLEQVDGAYQGACFKFREGFDCGVNRMVFGDDGSMFVGLTNRGWWSFGNRPWGLQRLVYTGEVPFEIHEMRAMPDGFEFTFTQPIDEASASDPASYRCATFTHHRWVKYGSPEIFRRDLEIVSIEVAADRRSVRLRSPGLRVGFIHEAILAGVRSETGEKLLHHEAFYTLNRIPD